MGKQTWIDLDNIDITSGGNKPETTKTDKILLTNSQTLDNFDNINIHSWKTNQKLRKLKRYY